MPYASSPDVTALNPARTFTATSRPDLENVARYLTETSALLDGLLAAQAYTLPVPTAATQALALLSHWNALGAYALSERAAESSPHVDSAERAWNAAVQMLRDGAITLPGLTKDLSSGRARAASVATPFFYRDMVL